MPKPPGKRANLILYFEYYVKPLNHKDWFDT